MDRLWLCRSAREEQIRGWCETRCRASQFALKFCNFCRNSLNFLSVGCIAFFSDADHTYTRLAFPIAWAAPETFQESERGQLVSAATDVYMLGSCFLELITGCFRTPFDWLEWNTKSLKEFREHERSRMLNCIQVGNVTLLVLLPQKA